MRYRSAFLLLTVLPLVLLAEEGSKPAASGPPFDISSSTPHRIAMNLDTALARDFLTVVSGSPDAPGALRRLRASEPLEAGLELEKVPAEQFFGRLAASAAGSPDPLFAAIAANASLYGDWLSSFETQGPLLARATGLRIASLLPARPAVTAEIVILPVFGLARFKDMEAIPDGERLYFLVDLERLADTSKGSAVPREALLGVLRNGASSAWKILFDRGARGTPPWSAKAPEPLDAFLSRTVSDGTATLFLFADEFFPLSAFLEEPVARSFTAWNQIAEALLDEKRQSQGKKAANEAVRTDDFWKRHAAVVGAQMADAIIRTSGRGAFLDALAKGPGPVAALYITACKEKTYPPFSKPVRKHLEEKAVSGASADRK